MIGARRLFVFGLGYSAQAFARRVRIKGWRVAGTARTEAKAAVLRDAGIESYVFERGRNLPPGALAGTTHLLVSLPPDEAGDPAVAEHGSDVAGLPGP